MEQVPIMTIIPAETLQRIVTKYRVERSASNNPPDELKSGLQKYCRRGETEKAMRCATELYCFRLVGGKSTYTNLIHRLTIIYLEDVGPSNYELWPMLDVLLAELREEDTNTGIEADNRARKALGMFVYSLSSSKHSRVLSHLGSVFAAGCFSFNAELASVQGLENVCVLAGASYKHEDVMEFAKKRQTFEKKYVKEYPRFQANRTLPSGKVDEGDSTAVREAVKNMLLLLDKAEDGCFYWAFRILMNEKVGKHFGGSKPGLLIIDVLSWYAIESRLCMYPGVRDRLEDFEELVGIAVKWYKELSHLKEAKLCVSMLLMWLLLAMKPSTTATTTLLDEEEELLIIDDTEQAAFMSVGTPLVLDDYAIDMHTRRGKSMGKNRIVFAEEGAFVSNEDERVTNPLYKQFYNVLKRIQDTPTTTHTTATKTTTAKKRTPNVSTNQPTNIPTNPLRPPPLQQPTTPTHTQPTTHPLESKTFHFDVRAQATCSDSRPDTYFAQDMRKIGVTNATNIVRRVFVKGPYKTSAEALIPIQLNQVKALFNQCIPSLDVNTLELVYIIPDQFPDVPLGIRRHVDRTKPHWFLVSPNLVPPFLPEYNRRENAQTEPVTVSTTGMPTKEHTTKCWGTITVVDWDAILMIPFAPYVPSILTFNYIRMRKYTITLLWRVVMGIPDPADRNFLTDEQNDRMYSLDEEGINHETNYYNALKKKKCEHILGYVRHDYQFVSDILSKWLECVLSKEEEIKNILKQKNIKWLVDKLRSIQTLQGLENVFSQSK